MSSMKKSTSTFVTMMATDIPSAEGIRVRQYVEPTHVMETTIISSDASALMESNVTQNSDKEFKTEVDRREVCGITSDPDDSPMRLGFGPQNLSCYTPAPWTVTLRHEKNAFLKSMAPEQFALVIPYDTNILISKIEKWNGTNWDLLNSCQANCATDREQNLLRFTWTFVPREEDKITEGLFKGWTKAEKDKFEDGLSTEGKKVLRDYQANGIDSADIDDIDDEEKLKVIKPFLVRQLWLTVKMKYPDTLHHRDNWHQKIIVEGCFSEPEEVLKKINEKDGCNVKDLEDLAGQLKTNKIQISALKDDVELQDKIWKNMTEGDVDDILWVLGFTK